MRSFQIVFRWALNPMTRGHLSGQVRDRREKHRERGGHVKTKQRQE